MMKRIVESLFLLLMVGCCQKQPAVLPALIPQPKQLTQQQGVYQIPQQLVVAYDNEMLLPAIDFLRGGLPADVDLSARFGTKGDVCLLLDTQLTTEGAYQIDVTRRNVTLRSGSYQGMISAIATLRQLVSLQSSKQLPYLHIEDAPSLAWRGFMLDVSRHFFSKEEVMALLEKMACYKFNKFHWHLTDDQGWRIEIKRYPELTEQGAWRDVATHDHDKVCAERAKERDDNSYLLPLDKLKDVDGKPYYGGYYTQDEIREVVTYAATLGIDVIPEIDMPGHSLQSVHCYPSLSCTGKASWGETFSTPLCLGNDATLEFCKNIYSELFDLFPYEYVHIGADEVEKTNWKKCPKCQQRIAEHHLLDEKGLQAWFVRDMEHFFAEHGRRMVGWDEIAEDSLSQTAVIMWWRSWMPQTLSTALKNGNEVILSPVEYLYLDDAQNRNSLLKSYGFTPADSLMHQYMPQIKGMQTHLWTEYIPSFDKACYHLFPRFFAASELAWSGFSQGDASDFEHRAVEHLQRLDAEGWNYRIPDIEGFCDENVFIDSLTVTLRKPFASIAIHYTLDGTTPNETSPRYEQPITIASPTTLKVRAYTASGHSGDLYTAIYRQTHYHDAVQPSEDLADGVAAHWYDYRGESCGEITQAPYKGCYITPDVSIPEEVSGNIGLLIEGYWEVLDDGIYSVYTYTDDGSVLTIDDTVVVDNDGPHSRRKRSGQIALRKGLHTLSIRYFDSNGGILEAGTIDASGQRHPFDAQSLKHAITLQNKPTCQ